MTLKMLGGQVCAHVAERLWVHFQLQPSPCLRDSTILMCLVSEMNALPDLDLNICNLFVQNLNSFCDQL